MQNVFNAVKGTALGFAEYLTPVLKVCTCLFFVFLFFSAEFLERYVRENTILNQNNSVSVFEIEV